MQIPTAPSERSSPSEFMPDIRRTQGNSVPPAQTAPSPTRVSPRVQPDGLRNFNQQSLPVLPEPEQQVDIPLTPLANSPDYGNNPFLARLRSNESLTRKVPATDGNLGNDENIFARNVPHRPQVQPAPHRATENLLDSQRSIRPSRLVTDALMKEGQPLRTSTSPSTLPPSSHYEPQGEPVSSLAPGTLLRGGRYRLRELQERQDWREGVYEATWIAQDAQREGTQVTIRELVTPESKSMIFQSTLRSATMALTSVGRHSHVPTLWDAFSDQGRSFFVFEPIEGESLMGYMRRTGRALPEQDVIECCLQMTEILEILPQQTPPLAHGLIRPEHIIMGRMSVDYTLTNFSIVLAGGATQYVTDMDRLSLSPYMAPEFARGTVDGRVDLYALIATAYHAATGSMPAYINGEIPQPRRFNPTISSEFDAILTRGLRSNAAQRYQRPSELRQDLLAMRSVNGTLTSKSEPFAAREEVKSERPVFAQPARKISSSILNDTSASQVLPSLMDIDVFDEHAKRMLLPSPEDLPEMPTRNDAQLASFWLIGILICIILVVIVSRGVF
jgi:serine/threonine protein kinase